MTRKKFSMCSEQTQLKTKFCSVIAESVDMQGRLYTSLIKLVLKKCCIGKPQNQNTNVHEEMKKHFTSV
jgi:hypothetical protein